MADFDAPAAAATPLVAALPAATAQQSAAATSNTGVKANNISTGTDAPVPFNLMPLLNVTVNQPIDVSLIAAPAAAAPTATLALAPRPRACSRAPEHKCKIKSCTCGEVQPPPEKSTSVKSTFFYQFLSTVLTPSKMMPTHGVPSSSPPKI
jgi:hypothetical protein